MVDVEIKAIVSRLNPTCTRALERSAGMSVSRQHHEVTVEHMLYSLIEDPYSDVQSILRHFGIDPGRLQKALTNTLDRLRTGNQGRPVFSPTLIEWFKDGWMLGSLTHRDSKVRSGHLIHAMVDSGMRFAGGDYANIFDSVSKRELAETLDKMTSDSQEVPTTAATPGAPGSAPARNADSALARFCTNLTERARKDEIDPIFGRDREIRQMVDILARRRKNNPIIVGDAGVGKTALAEGLALKIVAGDVSEQLRGVELLTLDLGLLQAGASVKGEFENRLKQVIDEVKASPKPIVMFIDEAHTLIGAGGAQGAGDASNLLKPALARGELRTVAATTWSEYKKYFEKDPALARRFQVVKVDEPSTEVAIGMLRGLRERYEQAHGVVMRDDAVVAAAEMGSRYIAGRQHPDKGVDLMDTATARVKISLAARPSSLQDLDARIQTAERERVAQQRDQANGVTGLEGRIAELDQLLAATTSERDELATRWEAERKAGLHVVALREQLAKARAAKDDKLTADLVQQVQVAFDELRSKQGKEPLVHVEVTPDVVGQVIADWTGIPVGNMVRDEAATLLKMEEELIRRVKGQDHVMKTVAEGIRGAKAGLKAPEVPMGVFLFVGPSGVGKTETALAIADLLFGGERFMTTINMSEFKEKHNISRLVGSPPGYVGYGEGGLLTEAVRQRPYSVVLLDECEKASLEVMELFYQVFDKGTLSDGEGREVTFKDTVIFLTSNLATDVLTEAGMMDTPPDPETLSSLIRPVLSAHFKPALLARMTIVPFYPLKPDVLQSITRLKLGKITKRLAETHDIKADIDQAVVEAIAARCTEVETGARNVDHIIRGSLLPSMSRQLLERMSAGPMPSTLRVTLGANGDFDLVFGE
ncbi:MAG: type VI secretion system ATPase TssH [Planctomycetes bacterium]|jgi:type VI secretion system protein VasG|nr:type VI secretion system ATPase TssH [Planctomycetota bacterium]